MKYNVENVATKVVLPATNCHSLHFNPMQANKGLLIIPPFTEVEVNLSSPVFLTNEVSESVPRLSHTSPIEFIVGGGQDKYVISIWGN